MKKKIWGKRVLLPGGWSSNTLIDIDQNGKYEFIVTGFGYPNLALTYDNGKLINIAK